MLRVLIIACILGLGHLAVLAQDCEPGILGRPVICAGGSTTLSIDEDCWLDWQWNTGSRAPSIAVTAPGRYSVTGRDADGITTTVDVDVSVVPLPRPTIGNPLEYICEDDVAVLRARDDYIDYRWSTGASGNTLIISEAGTYWLEVTDTNGCVGRSDEVEIVVVDRPDISISGPMDVCRDQELVYTTPAVNGATYAWSIDGGTILSGAATNAVRVTWQRSGSLQLRAVVPRPDRGTCDSTVSLFVQARPRVRPELTYDRSSFCTGDSITLTLLDDYPSWVWNTGSTARTITVTSGGPYWVEVTDTNGCPGVTDTLTVREYPLPDVRIDGARSICGGEPVTLTASSANNDVVVWQWSTNASTASITIAEPGQYRVVGWTLNGCSDTAVVAITQSEPLLVVSSDIDFGTVSVGVPQQGIITVENNGPQNVTIANIINLEPTVSIAPAPPRLVPSGAQVTFDVEWTPSTAGVLNLPLVFQLISSDCADTAVSFVRGLARNDTVGYIRLEIADTTIEAGRELVLPMTSDVDNPLPMDVRAHIYISAIRGVYDMRSWEFAGSVFGIPTVRGDRVELDFIWELDVGRNQGRINIVGLAMLGQPLRTNVVIDSVIVDASIPFTVDTKDGSVAIRGCWLPGRLVEISDATFKRRYFTIDGREVFDQRECRPCLEVLQDMNGMVIATYLTNNISR